MNAILMDENALLKKKIVYLEKELSIYKYDMLTGFLLRRDYELSFLDYNNADKDVYLTMIDINRLHHINNEHGYTAGDKLIIDVSKKLKTLFPKGDFYRIGGDEFAIFTNKHPGYFKIDSCVYATVNLKDYKTKDDLMIDMSKMLSAAKAKWYKEHKMDRRR